MSEEIKRFLKFLKNEEGEKADEIWVDKLSRKERKILKKSEEEKDERRT